MLDALDGFTQVPIDDKFSILMSMQTPWGRYRWLRLPYGISSALEEFQSRIQEVLDGLDGVAIIADVNLLFGLGDTPEQADAEHDRNFLNLLDRVDNQNLNLNTNNLLFKRPQINQLIHSQHTSWKKESTHIGTEERKKFRQRGVEYSA